MGKTNYIKVLFYENISDRVTHLMSPVLSRVQVLGQGQGQTGDRRQRGDGVTAAAGTTSVGDKVSLSTYTCL